MIRFEDQLIQMAKSSGKLEALTGLLSEESSKKRMSLYGKVNLLEHETRKSGDIVRECRTVFAFDNIEEVTVPAFPHPGKNLGEQKVRFNLKPPYMDEVGWAYSIYHWRPLHITFSPPTEAVNAEEARSPAEKEKLRKLLPAFRVLLKGFHITLKLKLFTWRSTHRDNEGAITFGDASENVVLYDVAERELKDDETLMRILEWNRYPEKGFASGGMIGPAALGEALGWGRILDRPLDVRLVLNPPVTQIEPLGPPKRKTE